MSCHSGDARLLAWEMVGYGRSSRTATAADISVKAQAGHLHRWLDELGIDRAVLVGHDLGGGVCQIAAVGRPERCAGLVLTQRGGRECTPLPAPFARLTEAEPRSSHCWARSWPARAGRPTA